MFNILHSFKFCKTCAIASLLVLTVVSCKPATITPTPTPVIQTVEVTLEVTREITRIVEVPVPVTVTPTLTPLITLTPSLTSTITPTPEPPVVIILEDHVACNFGPGGAYLFKYGLLATSWMWVIGRNEDGNWLFVEGEGRNPCWVKTEFVRFKYGGDVTTYNIQTVSPDIILPFATNLYLPPTGVQAFRYGNEVKIFWNAVWMTEDDYRGYLIEAWLCQGGQRVFKPINKWTSLSENVGTLVLSVIDEPGCLVPSNARIYTAEKHGYTGYMMIPWPTYEPPPTITP
jgi:hypothetical protein